MKLDPGSGRRWVAGSEEHLELNGQLQADVLAFHTLLCITFGVHFLVLAGFGVKIPLPYSRLKVKAELEEREYWCT